MEQTQLDIIPHNTLKLQLASVIQFMGQLQYEWMACSKCFESSHPINKGRSILSVRTAIAIHNGLYNERHGIPTLEYPFESMPWKWVEASKQAKIVTSVSLQHSRKKGIICQKMWVRFAQTKNGELFKSKFM